MKPTAPMTQPLLDHAIIITPEELNEAAYLDLSTSLFLARHQHPNRPITIRITGDGGETKYAFALYDLIQSDTNITGLILGSASSSHTILWCACQTRLIAPNAKFGLHQPSRLGFEYPHAHSDLQAAAHDLKSITERTAHCYADASTKPYDQWLAILQSVSIECCYLSASDLLEIEMAHAIACQPITA
jgi:ATP-dependent protease ClpP protease subunit